MESNNIRIKATRGKDGEKRRMSMAKSDFNFTTLSTALCKLFSIDSQKNTVVIKYQDEDDEWITLSSDQELEEARSIIQLKNTLHLTLFVKSVRCCSGCPKGLFIGACILAIIFARAWLWFILAFAGLGFCLYKERNRRQICGLSSRCEEKLNKLFGHIAQFLRTSANAISSAHTQNSVPPPTDGLSHLDLQQKLMSLDDMGCKDRKKNIQALLNAKGDLNVAIQQLVD